ncbi:MAG: AI-2E family transporter [bacterium]|nr:AI-2E family transporter [bacterium]
MNSEPSQSRQSTVGFIIGYAALFLLVGLIFWPYVNSIVFGAILAGTFYPLMTSFQIRFHIPHRLAVALVMVIIICAFIVPSVYLASELTDEAISLFQFLKTNVTEETLEETFFGDGYLPQMMAQAFEVLDIKYNVSTLQKIIIDSAKTTSSYLLETVNSWLANLVAFLIHFAIMMVVIYGILAEGERVKNFFLELSPLPRVEEDLVLEKFNQMNYVTLVGNGVGGLIQGALAGTSFWWAGIESIFLWTSLMVFLAFIPLVGMSVVYIPAGIYLFFSGKPVESLVVLVFCTAVAFAVEQWFKPKFVGNRVKIHSVLVFLSIIGGMTAFGFLGIFYGPLIMSIFLTFVDLYHRRYGHAHD